MNRAVRRLLKPDAGAARLPDFRGGERGSLGYRKPRARRAPDVIVLDLDCPTWRGVAVLKRLARMEPDAPCWCCRVRDREADKVAALDKTARDDYFDEAVRHSGTAGRDLRGRANVAPPEAHEQPVFVSGRSESGSSRHES